MRTGFGVFLAVAAALVSADAATACTTFNLYSSDVNILGRNYDWSVGDGAVIVNKRGFTKTAMKVKDETGTPLTWKSKYGSVTFNQYGREFPQGGINEAGLVVEVMAVLEGSEYPAPDPRPYVGKSQIRQYFLDSFSTVKEVIESDSSVRISATGKGPMTHLLASDRTGASAVIEFIGGKRIVYTGNSMPVRVLSNTLYADSLSYWKAKKAPVVDTFMSVARFIKAADSVSSFDTKAEKIPADYALRMLKEVAQGDKTKWSIVYDIKNLQVFFKTSLNPNVRSINMKNADFSCKTPVKTVDIDAGNGEISNLFQDYALQANRKRISDAFGNTDFLKNIPIQTIEAIASYPDSARCEQ